MLTSRMLFIVPFYLSLLCSSYASTEISNETENYIIKKYSSDNFISGDVAVRMLKDLSNLKKVKNIARFDSLIGMSQILEEYNINDNENKNIIYNSIKYVLLSDNYKEECRVEMNNKRCFKNCYSGKIINDLIYIRVSSSICDDFKEIGQEGYGAHIVIKYDELRRLKLVEFSRAG